MTYQSISQTEASTPYLYPITTGEIVTLREFFPEREPAWPELLNTLKQHHIKSAIMFSRPEYQLESLFHIVCRLLAIPACAGSVYNIPLIKETILKIKPEALISVPGIVAPLLEQLSTADQSFTFKLIFLFGEEETKSTDTLSTLGDKTTLVLVPYPF